MGKVQTLKPRLATLGLARVSTVTTATQRMTGRRLQARNRAYLREHPLCAHCEAQGRVTAAAEVDHKVPLHQGGQDVESNLQGLCIPCHGVKSAREAAERAGRGTGATHQNDAMQRDRGSNLCDPTAGNRRPSHAEKKSPSQNQQIGISKWPA